MEHWIQNAIFYHIYPLGFCGAPIYNGESAPNPRLDKLYGWLDHLRGLGVNALYLGPVCQSTKHGYDTEDYYRVDARLGDNASFASLCRALHEAGIRVVLDGVFNHVGRNFWAFRDVVEHGRDSRYCSWFQNLRFEGQSPLGDPFQYDSWGGHYELVKLNLRNPEVADHLLGAVRLWMDEFHIDGLRLDAADCVDLDFFRALRRTVREKDPDFWLMGEIIHGDYQRWANPDILDSVTNYECYKGLWSSHNTKNYFEIAHSLQRQFGPGGIYRSLRLYSFAENHDVDRLASILQNRAHLFNVYTLLYTMPGIPSVYYGGEWGVEGRRSPTNDEALRPCLDLAALQAGDGRLCGHLARLAQVRQAFPALESGEFENVVIKNEQFAFRRAQNGQRVYVLLNLSEGEAALDLPHQEAVLQDVLNGDEVFCNDGGRSYIRLAPCSARVLVGAPDRFVWTSAPAESQQREVAPTPEPERVPTPPVPAPELEAVATALAPEETQGAQGPLKGKVCVLAGDCCARGPALALALGEAGAAVALAGEGWSETAETLRSQGIPCECFPCQYFDEGRVCWVMDEIARRLGGIDALCALVSGGEIAAALGAEAGDYQSYLRPLLAVPSGAGRFAQRHMEGRGGAVVTVVPEDTDRGCVRALRDFTSAQNLRCREQGVRFALVALQPGGENSGAARLVCLVSLLTGEDSLRLLL